MCQIQNSEKCKFTNFIFDMSAGKLLPQLQGFKINDPLENSSNSGEVYSMFPIENEELLYTRWEDKVIWDATVSAYSLGFLFYLISLTVKFIYQNIYGVDHL